MRIKRISPDEINAEQKAVAYAGFLNGIRMIAAASSSIVMHIINEAE